MADHAGLQVTGLAIGGEGVGRLADGRAVFVAGALPGETVTVRLVQERKRYARAELLEVTEASPDRVAGPCRWFHAGCGGCDLMHLALPAQRAARRQLAVDALQRLGRVPDPVVLMGPELPDQGFRTTVRVAVRNGRAAFRRRASHDLVGVQGCWVAHPGLAELLAEGYFASATEVTLRMGAGTGERLAVVAPNRAGVRLAPDVIVVGADELSGGARRTAHYHEQVAGRPWRISAASFFQTSAVGAQALVDVVATQIGPQAAGVLALDAYCGVGLLRAALPSDARVVAVESSPSAVADARHNLSENLGEPGRPGTSPNRPTQASASEAVRVVGSRFEHWPAEAVDVAVADPARAGLGRQGAQVLAATGAATLVLVSCDLAALGRDTAELIERGYSHVRSVVVDLFPQTSHAEVVTRLERR